MPSIPLIPKIELINPLEAFNFISMIPLLKNLELQGASTGIF
jgi:hypothetical protein